MQQRLRCPSGEHLPDFIRFILISAAVFGGAYGVASVAVPSTNCYALDNSSRLVDFSSWIGHPFEYDGKESDLVVRFCKDVETRSQTGYVDFGRYDTLSYFVSGSGNVDFVQGFYHGDLTNCEQSYDKLGRTAQVNIICGNCSDGRCKGGLGCICSVTNDSTCRVVVDLAIPCEKPGPRVFKGNTLGFHPRSWEIVYNGMTQLGFEKPRREFSFSTEQTHLTLYMTAVASLSSSVGKPIIEVFPENGLEVKASGSSSTGNHPTTLSPTTLVLDWKCERSRQTPYEVNVTIPVEGYEPIRFFLVKLCEYRQGEEGGSAKGWAIFGVFSCVYGSLSLSQPYEHVDYFDIFSQPFDQIPSRVCSLLLRRICLQDASRTCEWDRCIARHFSSFSLARNCKWSFFRTELLEARRHQQCLHQRSIVGAIPCGFSRSADAQTKREDLRFDLKIPRFRLLFLFFLTIPSLRGTFLRAVVEMFTVFTFLPQTLFSTSEWYHFSFYTTLVSFTHSKRE